MKIESLNKDFWKGMEEEYPEGMKRFRVFLSRWAVDNEWTKLFNERIFTKNNQYTKAIGFSELPISFQIGIFDEFMCEQEGEIDTAKYNIEQRIMDCLGGFNEE